MIDEMIFAIKFSLILDFSLLLVIINFGIIYLTGYKIFLWVKKRSDKMEDKYLNRRRGEE